MKKVIEEFTGTIGIGCLVCLGIFFLTDSHYNYWPTIELLTHTNSWGILIPIPFLIVNFILGLITIEIAEILLTKLAYHKVSQEFASNFIKVSQINNPLLSLRYNEIYQNKRILNGSCIGFIVISIGIVLEGINQTYEYHVMGIIGMIASLLITLICAVTSYHIQNKFNLLLSDYPNNSPEELNSKRD